MCERGSVSGGQDPPHLRDRLKHVVRELEEERAGRPRHAQRPSGRQREPATGDQRREPPADDEPIRGLPFGLSEAQLGGAAVTRARQAIPVVAWVPYTGGRYHQVRAWAGEWTNRAVHLRWRDNTGAWDLWVHATDVQRSSTGRITGPPATMRRDTLAYPNGNPRRPGPE